MQTTIDLEPEAYERAQSLALERGQSIGKVLGDAVLSAPIEHAPLREPIVRRGPTGLPEIILGRPITLEEVREAIEDED